jgi:transcriptional regulator of acetoin/glycerol metabolism
LKASTLTLKDVEKLHITETIREFKGNVTQAAQYLGISRATIYRKLKTHKVVLDKLRALQ